MLNKPIITAVTDTMTVIVTNNLIIHVVTGSEDGTCDVVYMAQHQNGSIFSDWWPNKKDGRPTPPSLGFKELDCTMPVFKREGNGMLMSIVDGKKTHFVYASMNEDGVRVNNDWCSLRVAEVETASLHAHTNEAFYAAVKNAADTGTALIWYGYPMTLDKIKELPELQLIHKRKEIAVQDLDALPDGSFVHTDVCKTEGGDIYRISFVKLNGEWSPPECNKVYSATAKVNQPSDDDALKSNRHTEKETGIHALPDLDVDAQQAKHELAYTLYARKRGTGFKYLRSTIDLIRHLASIPLFDLMVLKGPLANTPTVNIWEPTTFEQIEKMQEGSVFIMVMTSIYPDKEAVIAEYTKVDGDNWVMQLRGDESNTPDNKKQLQETVDGFDKHVYAYELFASAPVGVRQPAVKIEEVVESLEQLPLFTVFLEFPGMDMSVPLIENLNSLKAGSVFSVLAVRFEGDKQPIMVEYTCQEKGLWTWQVNEAKSPWKTSNQESTRKPSLHDILFATNPHDTFYRNVKQLVKTKNRISETCEPTELMLILQSVPLFSVFCGKGSNVHSEHKWALVNAEVIALLGVGDHVRVTAFSHKSNKMYSVVWLLTSEGFKMTHAYKV